MQDVEFTIEEGRLYLLQTRSAKRPAQAAVRFAVDAVSEGLLTLEEALLTIEAEALDALLHPVFDPEFEFDVLTTGVAASPGAASGAIVLSAAEAVRQAGDGEDVILVRPFTEADDIAGFHAARGILTARGGKASHAALVARGMGRPCVAGASEREDRHRGRDGPDRRDRARRRRSDRDRGHHGQGHRRRRAAGRARDQRGLRPRCSRWSDRLRRLGVRANADTAEDAAKARSLGAEGIGLCRTEHMFFGEDRAELVRGMFVAAARWRRAEVQAAGEDGPGAARARGRAGAVPPGARSPGRAPAGRLRRDPARDARPAGDRATARPAAARVPPARALRGRGPPARGRGRRSPHPRARGCRDRPRPAGDEPDARHPRGAPGLPLPADLRDAGAGGDRRRGGGGRRRRRPAGRDHDPAGRLRDGAASAAQARGRRRRGGAESRRQRGPLSRSAR